MTFTVKRSDGSIARLCDTYQEAYEYIQCSKDSSLCSIEPEADITPRPHPYRPKGLVVETVELVAIKHDQQKPDYSLLPLADLEGLVEVLTYGASKYTRDNWKLGGGHDPNRLIAACLRHLARYQEGELVDQESGLSHIHHACCNLVFIMRQIRLTKVK